jgi:hypothetical protein
VPAVVCTLDAQDRRLVEGADLDGSISGFAALPCGGLVLLRLGDALAPALARRIAAADALDDLLLDLEDAVHERRNFELVLRLGRELARRLELVVRLAVTSRALDSLIAWSSACCMRSVVSLTDLVAFSIRSSICLISISPPWAHWPSPARRRSDVDPAAPQTRSRADGDEERAQDRGARRKSLMLFIFFFSELLGLV